MLALKRCLLHCVTQDDTRENFIANYEKFINIYDTFIHNLQNTKYTIDNADISEINNLYLERNDEPNLSTESPSESAAKPTEPEG